MGLGKVVLLSGRLVVQVHLLALPGDQPEQRTEDAGDHGHQRASDDAGVGLGVVPFDQHDQDAESYDGEGDDEREAQHHDLDGGAALEHRTGTLRQIPTAMSTPPKMQVMSSDMPPPKRSTFLSDNLTSLVVLILAGGVVLSLIIVSLGLVLRDNLDTPLSYVLASVFGVIAGVVVGVMAAFLGISNR